MSSAEIGRMHVLCRASGGREREALALRARLERTARTHLPGALDPVLARGGERVFARRVTLLLDFDPSDYDDVTVAALWAERVEAALRAPRAEAGAVEGMRRFASDEEFDAAALVEVAETGRLTWVFAELGCGVGAVRAAEVLDVLARLGRTRAHAAAALIASRTAIARGLYDRLAPLERDEAIAAFARAAAATADPERPDGHAGRRGRLATGTAEAEARSDYARPVGTARAHDADREPPTGAGPASFEAWRRALLAAAYAGPPAHASPRDPRAAEEQAAAPRPPERYVDGSAAPAGANRKRPRDPDARRRDAESSDPESPAWRTRVAGLAYLYPWLADYAQETASEEPPVAARRRAIAQLADPEDEALVADPLVRLLAGDDLVRPPEPVRPIDSAAYDTPAERVLASFAAEIPGFAESTPGFVRAHLVARGGILEPLDDGFRLLLEPAPLDPILDLLAYPVESFRLPWSPPVIVRRRGRDARS